MPIPVPAGLFVQPSDVKAYLQGNLAKNDSLASFWDLIILPATVQAYWDLVAALASRGFSAAQIAAWDAGPAYHLSQALFYCLQAARIKEPEAYSGWAIMAQDKRDELKGNPGKNIQPVQVTNNGVFQDPANPQGQAVAGMPADWLDDGQLHWPFDDQGNCFERVL